MFLFWGLQYAAPGISGIFNGTVPIWSFIAGAIILKGVDSFSWERAAGVLVGVGGLLVIMLPKASFSGGMQEFYGCMAFLIMAVFYALGNVMTKYIMVDHATISEEGNIFHQYLFAVVVMTAFAFITGGSPAAEAFTPKVIFSIAYIGIVSSAVAFLLLLALIKRLGAMRAAAVTYFTPLVAICVDIIFIKRMPTGPELLGVALIFAGQFLIQKPIKK
jgi:drug/metabolite transporter (DMT)-like permease